MSKKNMVLVIRHTFFLIFILIAVGILQVMAKKLMAQEQATEGEPKIQFLKIEPVPNNMVEVGKLKLGKVKEGEPIAGTIDLRLISTTSDSRISQSPMQVKISDVQTSGFTPPSDWYDRMTYKLKLADTTRNVELLSDGSLMIKQLNPKGEIKFQLEFNFPPVPKVSVFQALMDNQEEITGNITFIFEYLNVSPMANSYSAPKVYNNIMLTPVDFLITVSRSMAGGIGLIFLIFCGVVALGFFGWWLLRSEIYELELDGRPMTIRLSRITGIPLSAGSEQIVGVIRRGLLGGCRIAPKRGMQIDDKEKAKMLPDSGGSVTIDGGENQGYLSVNVSIRKLRETGRRKIPSQMESDFEYR